MNTWLACAITLSCILTIRLDGHIAKLATDWTAAVHVVSGLLPIGFLWALGAMLFEKKRRRRLIALTAVLLTLCTAPSELWYGLMWLPGLLFPFWLFH